ncbi:hypothetical protein PRIPAC_90833 [Pristionchus pacificus]|uniref:HEAT domain-containing protein n=1 Tax=Pristionchus pacificus TaxID=54126 RepID=A0A454XZF5_PRIPA|nr:hypothetical protein PRIPAC_90833 [Pristionchus pacificus]|eukprot:PDM61862.1 HEAT domain-containing protein [Pristionchus pacificus]
MDGWDYLEEVNVMERWPSEQRENVRSTKWAERRDALQSLLDLIDKNPRLSSTTTTIYGEIVDELKKILLKDSNVVVVVVAIKVVTGLARGLRRNFERFVGMVWNPLLEKAKDKKAAVREALPPALDAVAATCNLDRISGPLIEHMQKPSPETKTLLDAFLYRLFLSLPNAASALPFLKEIIPFLVKHASDSDASVRDGACVALGGVKRLMGGAMEMMIGTLKGETPKMAKITEACEKATVEYAEAEAARAANGGGGGEPSAAGGSGDGREEGVAEGGSAAGAAAAAIDPWTLIDPVELSTVMNKDFADQMAEKKWQDRKDALEALEKVLQEKKRLQPSPDNTPVIQLLNKVLEKDVNVVVASLAASCLSLIATALRTDFAAYAPKIMATCFDKFKEKKTAVREKVVECVDAVATTESFEMYSDEILAGLAKANPACRSQTALFLARLLTQHSPATLPKDGVRTVAAGLVKMSSDSDAECREASFSALAALLRCVGETAGKALMGEVAEDKIKMQKIEKLRDELMESKGKATGSEEMRRLHGEKGGKAAEGGDGQSTARSTSSSAANGGSGVRKTMPSSARPSGGSAVRKPPSSAPLRVAPPVSRPSTAAAAPTARPTVSRPGAPLSRPGSAVRLPATGRITPRGSRENIAPLTLEGAKFIGSAESKSARSAEHRPSTQSDLIRVAATCCSPQGAAIMRAEDTTGIEMALKMMETQPSDALSSHSDLICRWFALRLAATSTPPTLLQKLLPAAARTVGGCGPLSEQELAILMPAVMTKIGDTREVVRSDAKSVVLSLAESIGPATILPYLLEGLRSKIIRQKMDTLAMISSMTSKDSTLLETSGLTTVKKLLPPLLDCLSDRDALTRMAALNACVGVEAQLRGKEEWMTAIGKLGSKERSLLEERLAKAANGSMPAPRQLAPMPRPTVAPPSGTAVPSRPAVGGLPRPSPSLIPGSKLPRPGSGFIKK